MLLSRARRSEAFYAFHQINASEDGSGGLNVDIITFDDMVIAKVVNSKEPFHQGYACVHGLYRCILQTLYRKLGLTGQHVLVWSRSQQCNEIPGVLVRCTTDVQDQAPATWATGVQSRHAEAVSTLRCSSRPLPYCCTQRSKSLSYVKHPPHHICLLCGMAPGKPHAGMRHLLVFHPPEARTSPSG